LARGGYIMTIRPMAMGILVVPRLIVLIYSGNDGNIYPKLTPAAIATKIQRVRFLSKKLNCFTDMI
jgi:hypothetical protein